MKSKGETGILKPVIVLIVTWLLTKKHMENPNIYR